MERTFNAPRLKSQICLIGGNGFVCSSLNELNSNPLTFCSILFIVRILIRLTEVSGMNHMKYKTLIADRLGNSCLDAGFFISDKIIFYPISLIRSNFKSLLSHVLKKMFFQTCSKERKIHLYDLIIFYQRSKTLYFKGSTSIFVYMFKKKNT